jgi:hypothetical protein
MLTDNKIVDALRKYIESAEHTKVARDVGGVLVISLLEDALNLINSQKAEIERLNGLVSVTKSDIPVLPPLKIGKAVEQNLEDIHFLYIKCDAPEEVIAQLKNSRPIAISRDEEAIKAEAIKEFAKRLQAKAQFSEDFGDAAVSYDDIDNLVKEMTGGANADI